MGLLLLITNLVVTLGAGEELLEASVLYLGRYELQYHFAWQFFVLPIAHDAALLRDVLLQVVELQRLRLLGLCVPVGVLQQVVGFLADTVMVRFDEDVDYVCETLKEVVREVKAC